MAIPSELTRAFANGGGVVFVGAGMSMGAGLPSWGELIAPLRDEVEELPTDASYAEVADFFELQHDRNYLVRRLRQVLATHEVAPSEAHLELMRLPVKRI